MKEQENLAGGCSIRTPNPGVKPAGGEQPRSKDPGPETETGAEAPTLSGEAGLRRTGPMLWGVAAPRAALLEAEAVTAYYAMEDRAVITSTVIPGVGADPIRPRLPMDPSIHKL